MDLDLGADVDAARRLVEDQDPRLGREPLGQDDLLLVAAGERLDLLVDAGRADVGLSVELPLGDRALGRGRDEEPREQAGQDRQRDVLGDREVERPGPPGGGPRAGRRCRRSWRPDGAAKPRACRRAGPRRCRAGRARTGPWRPRCGRRRRARRARRSRPRERRSETSRKTPARVRPRTSRSDLADRVLHLREERHRRGRPCAGRGRRS